MSFINWISVNDAMPGHDGPVLVYLKGWAFPIQIGFQVDEKTFDPHYTRFDLDYSDVTHWAELPQPPGGEE